jgi:hypothetical protein
MNYSPIQKTKAILKHKASPSALFKFPKTVMRASPQIKNSPKKTLRVAKQDEIAQNWQSTYSEVMNRKLYG